MCSKVACNMRENIPILLQLIPGVQYGNLQASGARLMRANMNNGSWPT